MNVTELLQRIMAAYAGATNEAMKTFVPVFHARLRKHEGPALEDAATQVFASFKPKYDHRFPIPADFEAHLPSGRLNLGGLGESGIRQWLADKDGRRRRILKAWDDGQGAKIKANRPHAVYTACAMMAMDLAASAGDRLILTVDQIAACEEQALSRARVEMFGPVPKSEEAWLAQREQVRTSWLEPKRDAA